MKCVVCKSSEIQSKTVEEEVRSGKDIVLIPLEVLACQNCGERYYDRKTIKKLEEIKERLKKQEMELEEVGKVLRTRAA